MICSMTSSGFEMPPDQKASQMRPIWLFSSRVSMGLLGSRPVFYRMEAALPPWRARRFVDFGKFTGSWTRSRRSGMKPRDSGQSGLYGKTGLSREKLEFLWRS